MEGMMRKAVILGERKAGLVEMPIPKSKADWALVRMKVVPMCTEYKAWLRGAGNADSRTLGHEGAGEVVEVAQPCGVEVGDRVVLMGAGPCGRCEYCRSGDFFRCPNQVSYAQFTGETEPTGAYAQYRLGAAWLCPPSRTISPSTRRRWPGAASVLPSGPCSRGRGEASTPS